tara:strand:+ start:2049 stop:3203 length:1155 start_codon:yes stop_codon:yes gene_type:complete
MLAALIGTASAGSLLRPASSVRRAAQPRSCTRSGSHGIVAQQAGLASDIGIGSSEWLRQNTDEALTDVLESLLDSCAVVATKVRTASCDSTACFSPLGGDEEDEMAVDVLANELLVNGLCETRRVASISSESDGIQQYRAGAEGGAGFAVAIDPLSGSSIIDTNFAVGTIFGIWKGSTLQNVTGRELLAAGVALYGPRTTLTIALADRPGAHEFLLVEEAVGGSSGRWSASNTFDSMREGKLFAPQNLRASATHEGYARLLDYWRTQEYTLRYTGAAAVDACQLLVKGFGIFAAPASIGQRAPLRLLYQAMPLAFLTEKAGGASSDGERSLLDVPMRNTDHRTQVALGSPDEVRRFEEMVGPSPIQGWIAASARSDGWATWTRS